MLVPMYPLDGGRIFTGLLAMKMGRRRALLITLPVASVLAVGLLGVAFWLSDFILGFIALWALLTAVSLYPAVKRGLIPEYSGHYGGSSWQADEPWADSIPRYDPSGSDEPKPGFFERWRMRRQAKKRAAVRQREEKLQKDVDEILDKVKKDGMGALTSREKRILEEASRQLRNR